MHARHSIYAATVAVALWATAWADGTITDVKKESSGLGLKTWTVIGNKYQLQCSTNLVKGSWENISEKFTANLTTTNFTVGTEAESCWFRVIEDRVVPTAPTSPPSPPASVPAARPIR